MSAKRTKFPVHGLHMHASPMSPCNKAPTRLVHQARCHAHETMNGIPPGCMSHWLFSSPRAHDRGPPVATTRSRSSTACPSSQCPSPSRNSISVLQPSMPCGLYVVSSCIASYVAMQEFLPLSVTQMILKLDSLASNKAALQHMLQGGLIRSNMQGMHTNLSTLKFSLHGGLMKSSHQPA